MVPEEERAWGWGRASTLQAQADQHWPEAREHAEFAQGQSVCHLP